MKHSVIFDVSEDNPDQVIEAVLTAYQINVHQYIVERVKADIANSPFGPIAESAIQSAKPVMPSPEDITQAAQATFQHQPSVAESTAPITVQTNEVDVTGLPWDARIHAKSDNPKTAAGVWKRRRGVTDAEREHVEAELRANMATMPTPDNRVELPATGIIGDLPKEPEAHTLGHNIAASAPLANIQTDNAPLAPAIQTDNSAPALTLPSTPSPQLGVFAGLVSLHVGENRPHAERVNEFLLEINAQIGENKLDVPGLNTLAQRLFGNVAATISDLYNAIKADGSEKHMEMIATELDLLIKSKG